MHDVFLFFFLNSELLLEYGQERTPQSTLNRLGVFFVFFLKGTGMLFMIGWLTAKLNQSGLQTGIVCMAHICFKILH